ncbi:DUF1572 family protein [Dyadobacter sp. CY323]|uniref:DUF1572 family protein n=1 Tax=Dyadobacter sp. CY323 TaxID=2907302 RepID=UPI001F1FE960|nr:DUF1572 family protein [Dyadobacter sp. CY323]MCE6990008.1 DUF1572 domain-containing protein [Dyadobacter sp. CY323]
MDKENFIALFSRDIAKLRSEIAQYPSEESLWVLLPGTLNSGGNLAQHLAGNLRTYIGLTLGGFAYVRDRDAEFSARRFSGIELMEELDLTLQTVIGTLEEITSEKLQSEYPKEVLDLFPGQNVSLILHHLHGHLSYHLGQINYHRRWISQTLKSL